jgi:LCP family protein required for cell wall assembly
VTSNNGTGRTNGRTNGRANSKVVKASPRKAFAKFFVVTFLCGVVGLTAALGAFETLLNQKPMSKPDVHGAQIQPEPEQTEEKLSILIPAEGVFKTDPDLKDSKRVNIVLFWNTINNGKQKGLTDTIMLGSFDPDTKKLDVVSVPRDTYYEREKYAYGGYLKINSVMETEGVLAACESVHEVLQGVQINYYAVVDYDGVAKIVDSIDGVPMNVPFNMNYTSTRQNLHINIKKGKQKLDGEHAVQFLRYRSGYTNADIGRIEAQQKFMKAAVKASIGLGLPKVAQSIVENVDSDIDIRAMLYLATNAAGLSSDDIKGHMLPGTTDTIKGLSFWAPADADEIVDMMKEIYGVPDSTTSDSSITSESAATR